MKRNFLFCLLLVLCFSISAFAQSVVVTSRKMTYTRPKPLVDFKKTFTVTSAKIKAATPALSRKIESAVSFEKNFDLNIEEEKTEIQWLEETGFDVGYNKNGILTITLSVSGTGAYPSVYEKTVVVDLKTGNRIAPKDVFLHLQKLATKVKTAQKAEVGRTLKELKSDPANKDYEPFDFFDNTDFTVENLAEFAVDDKGVTFIYNYGFPHVVRALEPEGRFFFSWAELKPFINRGGLLAKFVR